MLRFVQFALLLGGLLVACGVIAFGAVFILTGGNLSGGLQTTLLRIQLASRQEELDTPAGASTALVRFTIAPGETPITIARRLEQLGLIRDADLFVSYLRVEGLDTRIQATTYFLTPSQTIPQIATTIIDSRNSSITFRVAEGWRLEEIAAAIDADPRFAFSGDEFLAATADAALLRPDLRQQLQLPLGVTLEGFMAPNTYRLPPDITAAELRDTFVEAFLDQLQPADLAAIDAKGMTIRDIVTLASIVERESVWPDENARIASVYLNRLAIGMPLQADPTVQYGLNGSRGSWWPQITQADYQNVVSPYNTYRINGLPPGPIANPSRSALLATIYPETTPYYYFRARCDGSMYHNFAVTYDEHLANGC
jgi:UPF0755 protein